MKARVSLNSREGISEEPIRRDEDLCSECLLCSSVCPFDAISVTEEGEPEIDISDCQLCGICAGVCPSGSIEIDYYNYESLIEYVQEEMEEKDTKNLVLACRGSYPLTRDMHEILKNYEVDFDEFVNVRLPCVGRVDPEFYIGALDSGIDEIVVLKCDEDFCRFEDGSAINTRWLALLSDLLSQFGYEDNITIFRNPMKAVYETADCVGCQKCEFICPYDAVEAQDLATPDIDFDECEGCGACSILCSEFAIQIEGHEHDVVYSKLQEYKEKVEKAESEKNTVLVFCCQWADFLNLDNAESGFIRDNVAVVEIPCFTGLDPTFVIDALESFDGVMVAHCSDEDCRQEEGRKIADRNSLILKRTLERLGLDERFETFETSPREAGRFDSELDSFISKLSSNEGD
ncbi:hypothetical protein AKJ51_04865 [candidate division MSBL1 archaeon SCGC-AAA382A20]|uniref:4Fe-4S ferredoxin-type domain-containing protein n=1 Tax=candidate division MSBL1 archaeon SCGC-AAA382A20 TaxID=1698280 RepID=A0A133VGZ2_9EURY|nr:hypothetical protein AKJ51_04865 [candidate division MSBL1 archaeon SCGC-AAA382A20]